MLFLISLRLAISNDVLDIDTVVTITYLTEY